MRLRYDWKLKEIEGLFALPFNDLLFKAHSIHRQNFNPNKVQASSLLNIKTGACPEDCAYCSQSSKHNSGLKRESLMQLSEVISAAKKAKKIGATRFCMGAAWRNPTDKSLTKVIEMIKEIKKLGMESCVTLGMLTQKQADKLKEVGLDYYNHNIDTSKEHYANVITTRKFEDRLNTLNYVQKAGINVCSGGIIGLGESVTDRASMLKTLADIKPHPSSIPINLLVRIDGTPFADIEKPSELCFIRTVAVARILMPKSVVRLSAGRNDMSETMQAICFFAGASSIFYGDELLTTLNVSQSSDRIMFKNLGIDIKVANS